MKYPQQPLSALGVIQTGSTPLTSEERYWGGDVPFVTPSELDQTLPVTITPRTLSDEGSHQSRLLREGAVMVCCIGSLGKIGIAGRPVATNQQINSVEFDPRKIWPKFGYYACRRLKSTLVTMAPATTIPIVSKSKFGRLEIPVPPLPEQRRIADILDQADALRAKRREALAQLDSLKQSLFLDLFRNELSSDKRLALSILIEEFRYGTSNKSGAGGYPTLRIPNVASGSLDLSELKSVEVDDSEFQRLKLRDGDLLFVRTNGNPDSVGRCAVFNPFKVSDAGFDSSAFIYASYLIRARIKKNTILPVVLQEFLSTAEGKRALRARSKTSAGQFNINTEGLGSLEIPCFSMPHQHDFLCRKQVIDQQQNIQRDSLAELDALFASLQHRAFRGEL